MFSAATKTAAAAAAGGYQISRSLRFNSADSTYLTRTPASASNRKTWTWSGWVKRSTLSTDQTLFEVFNGNNDNQTFNIAWNSSNLISIGAYNVFWLQTTPIYRDPSAWYHIVCAVDTTQATADNRIRIYVNGSEVTAFGTRNNPTQNADLAINQAAAHYIGTRNAGSLWLNGYLTEVQFIDGQQLTPSSFGETNTQTGVWQPKAYSGSYGTNGFYLNFSDNSNTTAATLGKDYSGNGNNWTPNNFSVTAGVGNDSLVDTPTPYGSDSGAGGEVRGNYCTLNPLTTSAGTYTQGNLRYVGDSNWRRSSATTIVSTGKWYWEVTIGNSPNPTRSVNSVWNAFGFGVPPLTVGTSSNPINGLTDVLVYGDNGYANNFGTTSGDLGAVSSGDVLSIAVDLDANSYTLRKNNSQVATGTIGGTAGRILVPVVVSYNGDYGVMDCNFGQRPFAYTAPSGFKALCTQNLPTPTIGATSTTLADDYFNTVLWTGTNTAANRSITGVGFQPDFVWAKIRSKTYNHTLFDVVRGTGKVLFSSLTNAEITNDGSGYISSFDSDGFTFTKGATDNVYGNETSQTYVGWSWKANGAGVTNTAGSVTSTVSANTTAGFSIVTFTTPASNGNYTTGHGLGVAPSMIITKSRNSTSQWPTWHIGLTGGASNKDWNIYLNLTNTQFSATDSWGSAAPNSTTFGVNVGTQWLGSTDVVAYCFAAVTGYSAFGSYDGNGATGTGGPFIYTGFRPAFVLIKKYAGQSDDWFIFDNKRDTYNVTQNWLQPDTSSAETSNIYNKIDILSNGFAIRVANASFGMNVSGTSFIYAAFAESPFKYSLAR